MNCRDFHNEFEENAELSNLATLHLDSCTNCKKYHFEQTRLWEMLGGLNKVEAPKDFDFQLKARIARSKPTDFQPSGLFPALRYVLPLSAVLVVLSVVALSGLYFVDTNSIAPVAVSETPNPLVNSAMPINTFVEPKEVTAEKSPLVNQAPVYEANSLKPITLEQKPNVARKEVEGGNKDFPNSIPKLITPGNKDSGGGSNDIAGTSPGVINPKGINPKQKIESDTIQNNTSIKISDFLSTSGMQISSLKVVSVQKNSIAERSGVKVGDVIEAINGKKITGDSLEGKGINITNLTVLRDGEKLEIVLR